MDKYEFNIKIEQIKKLVNKRDYETAMKIADTIDWRRVRNANLLSMVAQVYEKNEEYQEAKDILLLAFERAPIGKRLLFKLAELALKEGDVEEAEAYYREFCDLAPDDSRQHLLRYLILREKQAPIEQLIHSLEGYTTEELDEKWLYELAALYHQAGDSIRCVNTCDKIMLMFGLGKYVDQAMELKLQYAPLTKYQQDLVENRDKYERKLRAVEQSYDGRMDDDDAYEIDSRVPEQPELRMPVMERPVAEPEMELKAEPVPKSYVSIQEEQTMTDPTITMINADRNDLVMDVKQAEVEEHLAEEMSKISFADYSDDETPNEKTRILGDLKSINLSGGVRDLKVPDRDEPDLNEPDLNEPPVKVREQKKSHSEASVIRLRKNLEANQYLMIRSRTPEKGLERAAEFLKTLQTAAGIKTPVAKISGSKLNRKGLLASAEILKDKDLIIEEAGDLTSDTIKEISLFLERESAAMRIILIDNPKQIEMMCENYPFLHQWFKVLETEEDDLTDVVSGGVQRQPLNQAQNRPLNQSHSQLHKLSQSQLQNQAPEQQRQRQEQLQSQPEYQADIQSQDSQQNRPVRHIKVVREDYQMLYQKTPVQPAPEPEPGYVEAEEEMDIDQFAQYACKYAAEIDCSITGKSMLALYERIEIMEEDGIQLTRSSAEELIEEAADKAEKPSIGKIITGVFSSKYDKNGLLILKEEHFI